jgi:hypothetical protein
MVPQNIQDLISNGLLAKHDTWIAGSLLSHGFSHDIRTTSSCEKDDASPIVSKPYIVSMVYTYVLYVYI